MSTKKTIQISPELLKVSGGKTKKNRGKKDFTINPVINPNNLKNKLLKRIKEHKNKELKGTASTFSANAVSNTYSDEFCGAIDYLSDLTKKQKQERALYNKTLKKPLIQTQQQSQSQSQISLELPPELAENTLTPQTEHVYNVNYKLTDDIPYGCLKNGKKKTYREWKELTNPNTAFELPSMIRPPTPPKQNLLVTTPLTLASSSSSSSSTSSREERLEQIKDKLRRIQEQETTSKNKTLEELGIMETKAKQGNNHVIEALPDFDDKKTTMPDISELIKQRQTKIEKENPKLYTKKTIKRKLTLGKSDKLRRVAILIKNRDTRKKIIETQQKLKKTHITDVKKHLNRQGLIKIGSTCPPDIQRKIFESAMLAGDITNTNKETLLHNFLHSDKPV
jgi:hypothetical protein